MKLLKSICAEMDVVFKRFCEFNENRESGINNYEKFIKENFSEFKNSEITCYAARYDDMKLYPFKNWERNQPPIWWSTNNKLKHHRDEFKKDSDGGNIMEWYKYANQENVLNALSGLFQLNMYFYKEIINKESPDELLEVPLPTSKIFRLENWGDYHKFMVGEYSTEPALNEFNKQRINAFIKELEEDDDINYQK